MSPGACAPIHRCGATFPRTRKGFTVKHVYQLRHLANVIDPALLTHDDRRALLALIERSFDAATGHGTKSSA